MLPLYREPMRSVDVPTRTNEAYELVKQGGKGDESEMRWDGEKEYEYAVISAHSPAQPVEAGEVPPLPPLCSQVSAAEEAVYEHIP